MTHFNLKDRIIISFEESYLITKIIKIGQIKIKIKLLGKIPTYFIADIAANHDGDLKKAIDLIHPCAEAGADVAKFQHFKANTIVSRLWI